MPHTGRVGVVPVAGAQAATAKPLWNLEEALSPRCPEAIAHEQRMHAWDNGSHHMKSQFADVGCGKVARDRL